MKKQNEITYQYYRENFPGNRKLYPPYGLTALAMRFMQNSRLMEMGQEQMLIRLRDLLNSGRALKYGGVGAKTEQELRRFAGLPTGFCPNCGKRMKFTS